MKDDFTDTLRDVLDDPPIAPSDVGDAELTAGVTQLIRRRRRNLAAGSLAAVAVVAGIAVPTVLSSTATGPHGAQQAAQPSVTRADTGTQLPEGTIVKMIMSAAANYSVTKAAVPTSIQYVHGTRGELSLLISGDDITGSDAATPAVLVEATGNFSLPISGPVTYPNETGTAISLIINEQTGEVMDHGINKTPVDLAPAGAVVHAAVPK